MVLEKIYKNLVLKVGEESQRTEKMGKNPKGGPSWAVDYRCVNVIP